MASENYCTTELPEYIDFSSVLRIADERTQNMDILNVATEAAQHEDVNLCVLSNKDGGYGVRPLTLANPFLYAMMVRDFLQILLKMVRNRLEKNMRMLHILEWGYIQAKCFVKNMVVNSNWKTSQTAVLR